jgi:hypothetical protein
MSQELLRPVTRESYYRQFLGAMALDTITWIGLASLMIVACIVFQWFNEHPAQEPVKVLGIALAVSLGLLWSMATFVYGVGVATLHWRFWLPIVAAITMVYFFGSWASMVLIGHAVGTNRQLDRAIPYLFTGFCVVNAVIGLFLSKWTYNRWVRNDVI